MKTAMQAAKAMKTTMKGAKAMRVMKKKVVSKIAHGKRAKAVVFRGSKEKTSGGLTKSSLFKNKGGKIVSKKASQSSAMRYRNSKIAAWGNAVKLARKALGLQGFVAIGGKSAQGKALYAKAKALLAA